MTSLGMSSAMLERLAGALLHFVWQGAAIALVAAVMLRLLRGRPAAWRHAVASAALVAMLLAPLVTFAFQAETGALTLRLLGGLNDAAARLATQATSADETIWTQRIVLVWMIGVAVLLIRLVGGWLLSRRLVRTATAIATPVVEDVLQRARTALNFHGAVRLLSGARVETPVVIGWWRPAILLPASAITGLTPDQLLAIVAHELAHVRRHDFLVNGLQRVVECLLFYHPAVWWVSGRIRLERERCCDDLAVSVCGDRVVYARALEAIEKARAPVPALAVASAGIGVTDRVRRILGVPGANHDWQSVVAALVFAAILVSAGTWQPPVLAGPVVPVTPAMVRLKADPTNAKLDPTSPAAPVSALLAIATAKNAQAAARAAASPPAPPSQVTQPSIAASREAAREKLGRLRVDYSAESFVKQAGEGDTIAVKTFLAAGMDINARGEQGHTALTKAVAERHLETVQSLLAAGANPNLTLPGSSALSIAAMHGDLPMMKVLLAGGAEVDLKVGPEAATALSYATHSGPDAVVLLLDNKASIDAENTSKGTALVEAATNGRVDVVRTLLERGANVNARPENGLTALHEAASRLDVDLMHLLLDNGADVNARSGKGASPLLTVVSLRVGNGRTAARITAATQLLIQRGADVNAAAEDGETPLNAAVSRLVIDVVRALLDKGADPNKAGRRPQPSMSGNPPLLTAVLSLSSRPEAVQIAMLLIERGADVNARDNQSGVTPLIVAVQLKQDGLVRALLAKGADPNLAASNGAAAPLTVAASEEIRKLLIYAGAKP